ncbi:MAG: site-specific integrase [SAR202 cluster bacterium]|nr:site-specific integrase [SAR202 cluster bacterium]
MATRRGNQEGSITLRKDGLWVARLSHEGKRYAVYGRTRDAARQKLRELERKQDQGLPLVSSRVLLKDYLVGWLDNAKNKVRPKTYVDYETTVRHHIVPVLGQIRIARLTPEDIDKAWATLLREGVSASVVQHAHLRLSKALNDAMRRNLIFRNPCQAVSPPRPERRELRAPDANEVHRLLEISKETEYYEAIYTAFFTGLRRGELLALKWMDIDLDMATLYVNRSVYRAKGGQSIYQDPKTAKGRRLVSLTPSNVLILRSLLERQKADGLLQGHAVNEASLVFSYRDGRPILPRGISGAFTKAMRRAGLKGYRLHDARHAHASLMLKQGVHPKIVQERLGHSRIEVTLDVYSHLAPGLQEAAALRFEEGLNGARKSMTEELIQPQLVQKLVQ